MKWGLAIGVGAYLGKLLESGWLQKLGYQTEDGMIDCDKLYHDLKDVASKGPVTQSIPMVGDITFTEADIDSLYRRLR